MTTAEWLEVCTSKQRGVNFPVEVVDVLGRRYVVGCDGWVALLIEAIGGEPPPPTTALPLTFIPRIEGAVRSAAVELGRYDAAALRGAAGEPPERTGTPIKCDCGEGCRTCGKCDGMGHCRHCDEQCGECDGDGLVLCEKCRGKSGVDPSEPRDYAARPASWLGGSIDRNGLWRALAGATGEVVATRAKSPGVDDPAVLRGEGWIAVVMFRNEDAEAAPPLAVKAVTP